MGGPFLHYNETYIIHGHIDYVEDGYILRVMTSLFDTKDEHTYAVIHGIMSQVRERYVSDILNLSTQPMDGLDHQAPAGRAAGRSEEIFWLGNG